MKAISLGSIDNHSISAHVHEYDIFLDLCNGHFNFGWDAFWMLGS